MSHSEKIMETWSSVPPDWVAELARLADAKGLAATARRVGYGASTISQVLSNSYRGTLGNVEERVRGALMGETVQCPVQGPMPRNICLDWQKKRWAPTSAHRVQMFHACRDCPLSYKNKKEATDE
ncbi:transcriptional regulator [Notoacmeibacter ruber]|uniref:Transcriptional regulator n=1 Tax=Notoacmeibacter ruber TaxID=2670375 RepID=A0A3L7JDM3_9HYPH|nr:transcriptional regulator [Notoacmeibacter ruber]RLQ88888.1 transcriptional regulator [Notoacmeibacter ruber]